MQQSSSCKANMFIHSRNSMTSMETESSLQCLRKPATVPCSDTNPVNTLKSISLRSISISFHLRLGLPSNLFRQGLQPKYYEKVRYCVTLFKMPLFRGGEFSPLPKPHAEGSPFVGCPRLLSSTSVDGDQCNT